MSLKKSKSDLRWLRTQLWLNKVELKLRLILR